MRALLPRRTVRFWFSPQGREVLKGVFEKEAFQAYVHSVDEAGIWVVARPRREQQLQETGSVLLLKWEFVATLQVELPLQSEPEASKRERVH